MTQCECDTCREKRSDLYLLWQAAWDQQEAPSPETEALLREAVGRIGDERGWTPRD